MKEPTATASPTPSWTGRLFAGAELQQGAEALASLQHELIAERDRHAAGLAALQARLADAETGLKVRTGIMNLTRIVSEADRQGDIVAVNDKFVEVSQYSRSELIGAPHSTTRHPDMPRELFKPLWSTIGRGGLFRGVIKNRAKDGTPHDVDAVIAPVLGDNDKPRKYLGVRYDITAAEIGRQNARGILAAAGPRCRGRWRRRQPLAGQRHAVELPALLTAATTAVRALRRATGGVPGPGPPAPCRPAPRPTARARWPRAKLAARACGRRSR